MDETKLMSMKAFSEFAGINASTLRYYDRIGLFSPISRGENDYRQYSPQQIISINLINVLTELGVPLKQINEMVKNRTPEIIQNVLGAQERQLDAEMARIQESYSIIHVLRELIYIGCKAHESEICEQKFDARPIFMGEPNDFSNCSLFYEPFVRFCARAQEFRFSPSYPIGGYFENMEAFLDEDSQPTRFFSLDPNGKQTIRSGRYLVGYVRGYYGEMGDVGERLTAYAKANGLKFCGPLYVLYLHDEISVKDKNRFLAQVSAMIK
ncbi:MAG: MerR family transcriptional regulator [Clostridiales Family XIII bacterium]|jgi:DNA-binding transcriptional MerR regulator/effector-binding domain-containing protein|nr:MerR family transcriptional regulator [Clostridiales Family XIII bacterium]